MGLSLNLISTMALPNKLNIEDNIKVILKKPNPILQFRLNSVIKRLDLTI